MVALALVAVFAFGVMADAAPRKAVRHRTRHSSRVSTGTAASATTRKAPVKKRRIVKKRTSAKKTGANRHPATKPR
jgi:hypothetical protein